MSAFARPVLAFTVPLAVLSVVGCRAPGSDTPQAAAPGGEREAPSEEDGRATDGVEDATAAQHADIQVDGLTCPFCVYSVEERLRALDGVFGVNSDWGTGRVTAHLAPDAPVTKESLADAVERAGFTARSVRLHGGGTVPAGREEGETDAN